ncbi:hypothetical protein ACPRNU_05725 [Chromobacterium vaccinii]|uniref:hypothetical protein n=1 Tax=Chromobacterium vaccinii TaxID=1108595 RepID=UPI003C722051
MNTSHLGRRLIALAIAAAACALSSPSLAAGQPPSHRAATAAVIPVTKTYSVIVNVDGTLAVGPAGASSDNFGGNYGYFEVIFPSNVSQCVYTATIGDALTDSPAFGLISVTQRAGNPNAVFVRTADSNGTVNDHPFHLHVQC